MGKNNWPDFDAIIQKAVNAGRAQGMSIAKDAYKATERIESPKLAKLFLKEHPEVWHPWVSEEAAGKIDAAL